MKHKTMNHKRIISVFWIIMCMLFFFQFAATTVYAAPSIEGVKNLKEAAATDASITLKWSKVLKISGYQVYRTTSRDGKYVKIATIKVSQEPSYINNDLVSGKTYYYKVRAYVKNANNVRYGAFSKVLLAVTKPDQASNLEFTVTDNSSVKLTWEAVPGATNYHIYCATTKNGKYELTGMTEKTSYEYSSNSAATYYFKVAAVKSTNSYKAIGAYSNIITCSDISGMSYIVASADYNHEKYGYKTYAIINKEEVQDKVIVTLTKKMNENDFLLNASSDASSDAIYFFCPLDTDTTLFENSSTAYDAMNDKNVTFEKYGSNVTAYETSIEKLFNQNYDQLFHKKSLMVVFDASTYEGFKVIYVHFFTNCTGEEYQQAEEKAKTIAASFTGGDYDKVKFAYEYLISNTTYDYKESEAVGANPRAHSAYGALIDRLSVCDGSSEAFYLIMEAYGIPCNLVVNQDHCWNEVMIDGEWYVIDVTNEMFLFGQDIMQSSNDITYTDVRDTYIFGTDRVEYYGYTSLGNSTNVTLAKESYLNMAILPYVNSASYYSYRLAA